VSRKYLSYGVEPSAVKYRLRLARYPVLADSIAADVNESQPGELRLLDIGVGYGRTYRYVQAKGVADRIEWYGVDLRRVSHDELAGSNQYRISVANIEHGLPTKTTSSTSSSPSRFSNTCKILPTQSPKSTGSPDPTP
jgi:hypothetical protein